MILKSSIFKQLLVFLFLCGFPYLLRASSDDIEKLMTIIENGNLKELFNAKFPDFGYDAELIKKSVSPEEILKDISSSGGKIIIENVKISGDLNLDKNISDLKKVIFINCHFSGKLSIKNAPVTDHLGFFSCKMNKEVLIEDISTGSLTFIGNDLDSSLVYGARYKQNRLNQVVFFGNIIPDLSLRALNTNNTDDFWGKAEIKNAVFAANSITSLYFSGVEFKELLIMFGNLIKNAKMNNLKIDYFISCQYNIIDTLNIRSFFEREKASINMTGNVIDNLQIVSSRFRTLLIRQNKLSGTVIRGLNCDMVFRLGENIFPDGAEIRLIYSQLADFLFTDNEDTVEIATLDTIGNPQSWLAFTLPIREGEKTQYFHVNKVPKKPHKQKFSLLIRDLNIKEDNWHVDFNDIRQLDGFYRINHGDKELEKIHEVYTAIHNAYANQGKWPQADACYYEWKQFERENTLSMSKDAFVISFFKTVFNYLNWMSCGYGIKPLRIFPFAFFAVFFFALIYFITPQPISNLERHLISEDLFKERLNRYSKPDLEKLFAEFDFDFKQHKQDLIDDIVSSIGGDKLRKILNLEQMNRLSFNYLWNCFYFSFSTFTTVGIGDWYPSGNLNRTVVMIEGALGWLCLGLFITTYANILLR